MRENFGRSLKQLSRTEPARRAHRTAPLIGAGEGGNSLIERAIAMIETEAARIRAGDFRAVDVVLVTQGLALDAVFKQLARQGAEDGLAHPPMHLALQAQSQSRRTLQNLISVVQPRYGVAETPAKKSLSEQTVGDGDS